MFRMRNIYDTIKVLVRLVCVLFDHGKKFFFFFGFRIFNFHDTIFVKVEEAYMTKTL